MPKSGDGASGVNFKDICPICGKKRGKNCEDVKDIRICPNEDAKCKNNGDGQDIKGNSNSTIRESCIGYICGSIGIGTFLGSNIMLHRYSDRSLKLKSKSFNPFKDKSFADEVTKSNEEIIKAFKEKGADKKVIKAYKTDFKKEETIGRKISQSYYKYDGHPLYVESGCIQAHHLICSEAMRDDQWRALCKATGYNINCWKNGIFLPSISKLACYVGVQCHKGPHSQGMGKFGNESAYKSYVDCVKSELEQITRYNEEKGCKENTKTNVVNRLNKSSEKILNKIIKFKWTIAWDGLNYNHATVPYIGCAGESTLGGKKDKLKKALKELDINQDNIFWAGEGAFEDVKKIEKKLKNSGVDSCLCDRKEHKKGFGQYDTDINLYKASIINKNVINVGY